MLVLIVFETIFGYLRRFLVLHITARVDAQLSTYMFNKVLNLPIDFFERSSTGDDHPRHERDVQDPRVS